MRNRVLKEYDARSRMRFRIRIFILGGALLILLVLIVYILIESPLLRINKIEITGNNQTPQSDISQYLYSRILNSRFSYFLGFYNFLSWPNRIGENNLALLPTIKQIDISKDYLRHVLVANVVERQPSGVWCFEKDGSPNCFWFDSEGIIFKKAFATSGNLVFSIDDYAQNIIPTGGKILPDSFLPNFFSIMQLLNDANLNIKEIRLNDLNLEEIEVDLNSGPKIYFSLRFDPSNDLSVINYLRQNKNFNNLQYIDFRSENKAFYK
ncbi:MAG: hypothetical protein M1334_00450 [Patescibacteria group bacterium]|nr:hypothetical protein [Patescibacteria group bacterium]